MQTDSHYVIPDSGMESIFGWKWINFSSSFVVYFVLGGHNFTDGTIQAKNKTMKSLVAHSLRLFSTYL